MYSSIPTHPYDIHPNEFLSQNFQVLKGGTFGTDTGESSYTPSLDEVQTPTLPYNHPFHHPNNLSHFQPLQVGLAPTFPTDRVMYNGGFPPTFQPYNAVPPSHFQTQPSLTTGTVLSPTPYSSTSLQDTSPASLQKRLKAKLKSKEKGKRTTRKATQFAKRESLAGGNPKRMRGPNKRPPGTSLSDLLDGLPHETRKALEQEYQCCGSIAEKSTSTIQKHWFTKQHRDNLPKKYREVPTFVCPAFLAFNTKCRAKAGRYDSAERHCQNCAGFKEISSGQNEAPPVEITQSGYSDVQLIRTALAEKENREEGEASKLAFDSVRRMLAALFKNGLPAIDREEGESNEDQMAAQPPPTTPEPAFEPDTGSFDWGLDTSQVINCKDDSIGNGSNAIVTAQPVTASESEPMLKSDSFEWGRQVSQVINCERESIGNGSGAIVDQSTAQPVTTLEVMSEPGSFEWDLHMPQVINCEGGSTGNDSGAVVDHPVQPTAHWQPPTTSGPVFEPDSVEWCLDNVISSEFLQD